MRRSVLKAALASAAILTALPAMAADQAMVVLDLSGSMSRASSTGEARISMARTALDEALANLPADLEIGLTAFGHRQAGSCTDIEVLAEPRAGAGRAIAQTVRSARPRGETPIGAALEAAAEAVDYTENKATLVLVTDAVGDACTVEFCSTVEALERAGADLTIHVLGLGLSQEARARFACVSEGTGGRYFAANEGAALAAALNLAVTPKPPPPPLPVATLDVPEEIGQGLEFEVAYDGPRAEGDQIQIAWPGSAPGAAIRSVYVGSDGEPRHLMAPSERGVYAIRYWLPSRGAVIAEQMFEVVPVVAVLNAPESVGQGTLFAIDWQGPDQSGDRIELARPRDPMGTALAIVDVKPHVGEARLDAPIDPGRYELRYVAGVDGSVLATRPVEVTRIAASLTPPAEIIGGAEFEVSWDGPGASFDEVQLAAADAPPGERFEGARVGLPGRPVRLDAPVEGGSFELRYWSAYSNTILARTPVTITAASATLEAPREVMGGSEFAVTWNGPGARFDEIQLVTRGMPPGQSVTAASVTNIGNSVTMAAPIMAGDYELRYWSTRSRSVLGSTGLRVGPAEVELRVEGAVRQGEPFRVAWEGPAGRFDELQVVLADGGGAPVFSTVIPPVGEAAILRAPALPGTYVLRYWSDEGRAPLGSVRFTVERTTPLPQVP
ncbi:MAG: VWA domain-containing protein [Bauldia sp.]|nr:VWA domain-containing protein [Bauldia sp.]